MLSIAIIDTLGLSYDGSTLNKRGLGGSESAVILLSKELVRTGFDVTVLNDCYSDGCLPGLYDGVKYVPLDQNHMQGLSFDIIIGVRSVAAFAPLVLRERFKSFNPIPDFELILSHAKYRILWMHDTFCDGDDLIEDFVLQGRINEIFTLSDFHTSYIANCDHGKRRNFEVLKNHIYMTRNGIGSKLPWVDVAAKDPNLFVYNASVTKGMIPLIERIWPKVKAQIPQAKLKVIGGFYRFRSDHGPDEQENKFHELKKLSSIDVEFTGIIKQSEIAEIMAEASYMIYPAAFPETFGISSLEALAHNTPLITCRFGALEETAIDLACYKIPYAIEPNGLFPWFNSDYQVDAFVDVVVKAYNDKYLHQQKMYACNQVKDICTWDTVALQWKQHFYKVLGEFLPVDEYRKVSKINHDVAKVFGRRFSNPETLQEPRTEEQHITIITPVYNAEKYIEKCILSVLQQDYNNYHMIIIDDASTDNTLSIIKEIEKTHPHRHKFSVIQNNTNKGAVYNQVNTIIPNTFKTDIIMLLDGDDWLINDPNIFHKYNNMYAAGAQFTYGSCWSLVDNIPLIAQPYPPHIKKNKAYREHRFNWNMPYSHLRTFRKSLLEDLVGDAYVDERDYSMFKDENGEWLRAGGDTAIFYNLIEQADPDGVVCVPDIVYNYNDINPLNDYKVNGDEQTKNANKVLGNKVTKKTFDKIAAGLNDAIKIASPTSVKKILIAIPTANDIHPQTFKSIYDLEIPEGCETTFQYFYGYNVDQVRNLIADWTIKGFDYLFAVDHDMSFAPDTLKKLLSHDKDIVTGLYRQRLEPQAIEVYDMNQSRISYDQLHNKGLVQVGGCGFGCVLVKKEVFANIGYPQFVYHHALDHAHTFSEDMDFCKKARDRGFQLYADTRILCAHHGHRIFNIELSPEYKQAIHLIDSSNNLTMLVAEQKRLRELGEQRLLPSQHVGYLYKMRDEMNIRPKVVYDIGACVMHWTNEAKRVWPEAEYVLFEAMDAVDFLYRENGVKNYHLGVLFSSDDHTVDFYENTEHPGGNSCYKENVAYSPIADQLFPEDKKQMKITKSLDTIVRTKGFPLPDLIKMDVQGAELDILKGAQNTLKQCNHVILELQHVDYNFGAAKADEVSEYMLSIGFVDVSGMFCGSALGVDGDYHFMRMPKV